MNKRIIHSIVGIILLAVGLNILLLTNVGYGPFDSLTYALQSALNIDEFGNASFLLHLLFALLLLTYNFFKKKHLIPVFISILSIFILTRVVNFFSFLTEFTLTGLSEVLGFFLLGFLLLCLGLLFISKSNLIIPPFDKTIVEAAKIGKINLGTMRIGFDVFLLTLTIILKVLLEIDVVISLGTLFLTVGTGFTMKYLEQLIEKVYKF